MKKRELILLLLMVLLLSSCAAPSGPMERLPEKSEPKQSVSENAVLKEETVDSTYVEEELPHKPVDKTPKVRIDETGEADRLLKKLQEEISRMEITEFVHNSCMEKLQGLGCTVSVENLFLPDANRLCFDLVLKVGEEKKVFAGLEADLNYSVGDWRTEGNSVSLHWGCLSVTGGEICVADRTGVQVWDPAAQKVELRALDTVSGQEKPVYVHDIYLHESGWYVVTCYRTGKGEMLCLFDEQMKLKKEILLEECYSSNQWKLSAVITAQSIDFCSDDLQEVWFSDWMMCLVPGSVLCTVTDLLQEKQDDVAFTLKWLDGGSVQNYLAEISLGEEKLYRQILPAELGNGAFCYVNAQEGATKAQVYLGKDGKSAEVFCPYSELAVTFFFETESVWERYRITDAQTENREPFARSADGRYALYQGAGYGGGDFWAHSILLKDMQSGKYSYVGTNGGMYGGGEEAGFFSNGDIYLFGRKDFIVYEKGMPDRTPKFVLSDNFPLKTVNETEAQTRILFAVRRDPQAFTYIVMYADCPQNTRIVDSEGFNRWLEADGRPVQYKIGLLDTNGVLQQSFETGVPVMASPFGYHSVDMYLEDGDRLHFILRGGKQSAVFGEGVFDLTTQTTNFERQE